MGAYFTSPPQIPADSRRVARRLARRRGRAAGRPADSAPIALCAARYPQDGERRGLHAATRRFAAAH